MFQNYMNKTKTFICVLTAMVLALTVAVIILFLQWSNGKEHSTALEQKNIQLNSMLADIPVSMNAERIYSIDKHLSQQLEEAQSNADRNTAYAEATQQWQTLIQVYLDAFAAHYDGSDEMAEYDEKVMTALNGSQGQWESYCKNALNQERDLLVAIYQNGTAASTVYAKYEYSLYRSRALELYELAKNLGIVSFDLEDPSAIK